jgi:uncharacterized protein (TIGR02246 family)
MNKKVQMKKRIVILAGMRTLLLSSLILVLAAAELAGATGDEAGAGAARKAIAATNLKFGEAVRQGNAAAIGALYAEDATLLPPASEIIKGRAGIQEFWGGGLQMGIKDAVLTTVGVSACGDTAIEIGTYALKIQPGGQADIIEDHGKYVVIWKKAEGTWKLSVDIWNTSIPAQK